MTEFTTILVDVEESIATITLNRPDRLNAAPPLMFEEINEALTLVPGMGARALLFTGAGRAFSAGADIGGEGAGDGRGPGYALEKSYNPCMKALADFRLPVVAAVNGLAAGIGCSLALAADLIVAKESAYFLLAFVNIGLVPDGGSSLLLPERVGLARATEMAMLGERIGAGQALEWGLINRVTADDELDAVVDELAARLAGGPTRAYAGIKRQFNAWLFTRMAEQLDLEASIQQASAASGDFLEGVQAFLEKRPAAFSGR